MIQSTIRWSGHDLMPLAYESIVSCLLRLSWRNALDERALKRHVSSQKNRFVLDLQSLLKQTCWYLDEDRVRRFDSELRYGRGSWLIDRFRYCPICLECAYHSDLHQCVALTICPLHMVSLSVQCHCCGRPTASYEVSKELFRRPYYCHECLRPISGAAPSLDAHLDLRADASILERALGPYEAWWQEMEKQRKRVHCLRPQRCLGLQAKWCNSPDFLRGVACKGRQAPEYVFPSRYAENEIVVLAWRYRVSLGDCASFFNKNNTWYARVGTAMAVYRCTLRMLGRWLARRHGWTEAQFFDQLHADRGARVSAYPVDLLAFLFLRWQLERRFMDFPDFEMWPIARAQLDDQPSIAMHSFCGRTPRLAWRAIFLAIYASWHGRITSGKYHDLASLRNKTKWDATYIFSRNRVHSRHGEQWFDSETFNPDEAWFEGEVSFLKIGDMPLQPWKENG